MNAGGGSWHITKDGTPLGDLIKEYDAAAQEDVDLEAEWDATEAPLEIPEPTALSWDGPPESPRETLLEGAIQAVMMQRNNQYGPPTQDFERTAALWNTLFGGKADGRPFVAHDVAIAMIAIKLSRITWSPEKEDSWMDIAGYTACGWECVVNETG